MGINFNTAAISASETGIGFQQQLLATLYGNMFEKTQLGIRCDKATLHAQHLAEHRSTINAMGNKHQQNEQPLPTPPATKEPTFPQLGNANPIPLAMNTNGTTLVTAQLMMASVHAPIPQPINRQPIRKRRTYLIFEPGNDGLDDLLLIFWDHQRRTP